MAETVTITIPKSVALRALQFIQSWQYQGSADRHMMVLCDALQASVSLEELEQASNRGAVQV